MLLRVTISRERTRSSTHDTQASWRADIVQAQVEVVVTAANAALRGGGGVDGAIHRAAGPELLQALRSLAPCQIGGAVITPAFGIPPPVRFVVHAVGPRYGRDEPAAELLAGAYAQSLARCDEVDATTQKLWERAVLG
ncbi:MAG TPA: macro domain-containing protein [Acidothermaceae bacterium]|nr:macro domain-containing protein [Acidothermaceae bacterium]